MKKSIRRIEALLLAGVMVLSVPCTNVIWGAPSRVDEIQGQVDEAQQNVQSLEAQMADVLSQIYDTEAKMVELGEEILKAEADLEEAKALSQEQNEKMKLRIKTMYENGDSTMIEKIFSSGSLTELLKQAENVQAIHEYDRAELQKYIDNQKKIKILKTSLEADMKTQQGYKKEYEAQKEKLATTLSDEKAKVADLSEQLAQAQKEAQEEARRRAEAREAEKKRREEERKKREEEQRKKQEEQQNKADTDTKSDEDTPTADEPTQPVQVAKGDTKVAQKIINAAYSYIGTPYVWGGTSYRGIDCSGLTMMCHQAAGISIPRVSYSQAASGQNVGSLADALPGDVICYPGHVAVYIGNNQVIHAPTEGQNVKVASVYMSASQPITAIRRYW